LRLLAGRETEASPRWTRMESLAGRQSEADLTAFAATNLINLRLLAGRQTEASPRCFNLDQNGEPSWSPDRG
jgi:hypothetical protein